MTTFQILMSTLLVYGYGNYLRSVYYRRRLGERMVRTAAVRKQPFIGILVFLAAEAVSQLYRYDRSVKAAEVTEAGRHLVWAILSVTAILYFVLVIRNSRYVYIAETMILFPDCARKASGYHYRLTETTVELLPVKPPHRLEIYRILEERETLKDLLAANYQPISES